MLELRDTVTPVFRALADPTRRWYLECLLEGRVRLLEFAEMFPISQPTVLYHLRVLAKCGLITSQKEGPSRVYSLRPEGLRDAESWLTRAYQEALCHPPEDCRARF